MKKLLVITILALALIFPLLGVKAQEKPTELEHYALVSAHLCESTSGRNLTVFAKSANDFQVTHNANTYFRYKEYADDNFTEWQSKWMSDTLPYTKTVQIKSYYAVEVMVETTIWEDGYNIPHQSQAGTVWDGPCSEPISTPTIRPTSISTAVSTIIPDTPTPEGTSTTTPSPTTTQEPTSDEETSEPGNKLYLPLINR